MARRDATIRYLRKKLHDCRVEVGDQIHQKWDAKRRVEKLEAQLADSRTPCLWTRCAWPEWATGCGEYTASAASHCPFCGHPVEYLAVEEVAPHE